MADLIVRDEKDYSTADAARASLPEEFADFPYVGVWVQQGDSPNMTMYVFTTQQPEVLAAAGWLPVGQ